MGTFSILKATGLQTANNYFSNVSEGGLLVAKNVVITHNGVLEPRRGHKPLSYTYSSPSTGISNTGAFFGTTLVVQHDPTSLSYDTGSAFFSYAGTFAPVDDSLLRMKFVEAKSRFLFNTSTGLRVLQSASDTPRAAGFIPPLPYITGQNAGIPGYNTTGWLSPGNQVAYRCVFLVRDSDGTERYSEPSGRFVVKWPGDLTIAAGNISRASNVITVTLPSAHGLDYNIFYGAGSEIRITFNAADSASFTTATYSISDMPTSTTLTIANVGANASTTQPATLSFGYRDPRVLFEIPPTVVEGDYYRIYRSVASGSYTVSPDDELYLVYEGKVSASDITLGDVRRTDTQPTSLLGDPLYTNSRQGEGILQANTRPPVSKDVTYWQDRMWYANTTGPHRFELQIIGSGSPDGVQNNDTLTVGGYTASFTTGTAVSGVNLPANGSGGPYDISNKLDQIAEYICTWINANSPSFGLYAYKISGSSSSATSVDIPGKLVIESTALGGSAFSVYSSRTTAWNPVLTNSSSGALTSDANRLPNGLYYSKLDQPEAVPLLNYLLIGAKNKEILRIVPLRDKLYVFKEEEGIYTVAGEEPFRVDLLDGSVRLLCPDSAVVLNNQIYCFTTQGICTVSDTGVQILSRAVEDQVVPYLTDTMQTAVKRYGFGLANETDRTYELWLPSPGAADNRVANKAFVYNAVTNAWTTWEGDRNWGSVSSKDVRYYGGTSSRVIKERRDGVSTDNAEDTVTLTLSGSYSSGVGYTSFTVTNASSVSVGDSVQGFVSGNSAGSANVRITAISGTTITVANAIYLFGLTTVTVDRAIECEIKWLPVHAGSPGSAKRFSQATLHFNRAAFGAATAVYSTDASSTDRTTAIAFAGGWGAAAWGTSTWGQPTRQFNARHLVPAEKQRGAFLTPGFTIREAFSNWKLQGLSLEMEVTSERNAR